MHLFLTMESVAIYVQLAVLMTYILAVLCQDDSLLTDAKLIIKSPVRNGTKAYLDCYYQSEEVLVRSVQWYKVGNQYPVYSFQAGKSLLQPREPLIGRAVQKAIDRGHYRLVIKPVLISDEGTYKCHVFESFYAHKEARAFLGVTVPPKTPKMAAPTTALPAFSNITLACTANVGKPAGQVRWWRRKENQKIFSEVFGVETRPRVHHQISKTTTVVSEYFTMVTPSDNGAVYKCTAENSALKPEETPKEARTILKVFWTGQIPDNVNVGTTGEAKDKKDKKETGFHVAGIFVLSLAGIGLLALMIICARRRKTLQNCHCGCGKKKEEKDPTISTLQGAQVRVTFRDTEFDAEDSRV